MKKFILFARLYTSLIFAFPLTVAAQLVDQYPNYVVIGAFAHLSNAVNFTDDAKHKRFPARFEMNPNRNLYYVYVLATDDRQSAIAEAVKLRADTKYFDTWVYCGALGNMELVNPGSRRSQDIDPVTGSVSESADEESIVRAADQTEASGDIAVGSEQESAKKHIEGEQITASPQQQSEVEEKQSQASRDEQVPPPEGQESSGDVPGPPPERATTEPLKAEDVVNKNFYFHIFRADNGKMIPGEVEAIDFERARRMATYQGNKVVTVRMPSGKTKQVSFLCQVFGYRKQQQEFDPNTPAENLYLDNKGNLVVPFELVRLQKGDIAIMYNVFFFKDAAVMRPESRYEVNNLLELLEENPSYNIKIHGHTNGNASGKILRMGTPGNFYSLTGTKQGFGSAKTLSEERAIVIRDFLISSGISPDRMEVKAWGGKKPIHDKHSARAHENVRVEIEILSR